MNDASGLTVTAPQSPVLTMTLRRAAAYAQQRSHRYVTLEHLLLALTDDQDAMLVMRSVNSDIEPLRARAAEVVNRFLSTLYAPGNTDLRPSYKLERLLHAAGADAAKSRHREVDGAFVVAALTAESDSVAAGLLRQHGLGFAQATGWIYANRSAKAAPAQNRPREAPRQQGAPDNQRPIPSLARVEAPNGGGDPKLEDMLSSARHALEREDRATRPNGGQQPQQFVPVQPPEKPFNASAFAPIQHPSGPARRDRKLSVALENARPDPAPVAAAPSAPTRISEARALVVSKSGGKLNENIPRKMRKGGPVQVEVRISREETMALFRNFQGRGAPETQDAIITRAMTVTLKAPDGGFVIETQSPETQWIFDRPSFLETERFGRWRWTVTPSAAGKRRLQLVAVGRSIDENGMADDVVTPDQVIEIRVRRNYWRGFRKALFWLFLLIAGGVIAETALRFGPFLF